MSYYLHLQGNNNLYQSQKSGSSDSLNSEILGAMVYCVAHLHEAHSVETVHQDQSWDIQQTGNMDYCSLDPEPSDLTV